MNGKTVTACRRIQFCAGHRVFRHESKCRHLHGHNYVAVFHATAEPDSLALDELGRVIDFSVLKSRLGGWIDEHWDHAFIAYANDTETLGALRCIPDQRLFLLPDNPTAENMALYLLREVCPTALAGTGVRVVKIELWETENCHAVVEV